MAKTTSLAPATFFLIVLFGALIINHSAFADDRNGALGLASKLGDFFARGDGRTQPTDTVPVPLQELTGRSDQLIQPSAAPIVVAQSKKQLGQGIAGNSLRIDQLQEQIRQLTGQIEQLIFENQRLQEQLRLIQEDNEARLQELEGGQRSDLGTEVDRDVAVADEDVDIHGDGGDADLLGRQIDQSNAVSTNGPVVDATPGAAQPLDLGASVRRDDAPNNDNPVPQSADPLLQPNGVASLGTLEVSPDSDPEGLYNLGYSQLLNGDYSGAEQNLRLFLERFPSHRLAGNSRYWLGETFFARGQFSEAVTEFSTSYKGFPQSDRAPDSLLKLGISLARLNERDAACATLAEMFVRFPNASRSLHSAARDEQVRYNCS